MVARVGFAEAAVDDVNNPITDWLRQSLRSAQPAFPALTNAELTDLSRMLRNTVDFARIPWEARTDIIGLCREFVQSFVAFYHQWSGRAGRPPNQTVLDEAKIITEQAPAPFSCFQIYRHTFETPDLMSWANGFLTLSAIVATDNPNIAHSVARYLAQSNGPQSASRWLQRAISLKHRFVEQWTHRDDHARLGSELWSLGGLYREIAEDYAADGDLHSAIRYRLTGHMAMFHQPDYGRLVEMLVAAEHDHVIPNRPMTPNDSGPLSALLATVLGTTIRRVSVRDVENSNTIEVFPGKIQAGARAKVFGTPVSFPALVELKPGTIHTVPNARCYVDLQKTAVITKSGQLVDELRHGPAEITYVAEKMNFLRPEVHQLREFSGRLALVSKTCAWEWYSHWLNELLPMVGMLIDRGMEFDNLIAFSSARRYCREGFELMGIDPSKIIDGDHFVYASADELVVPRACVSRSGDTPISRFAIDFVRNLFLGPGFLKSWGGHRIMISRKKANYRHLLNEEALMELLEPFGFERVFCEDISVRETARVMNGASIVVGLHGAGMGNVVFCGPGTTIIELHPPMANNWIQLMSGCCNLNYICVRVGLPTPSTSPNINSDVVVELNLMKEALAFALQ
jgi:capsular polysaccharide biosynthesis protein